MSWVRIPPEQLFFHKEKLLRFVVLPCFDIRTVCQSNSFHVSTLSLVHNTTQSSALRVDRKLRSIVNGFTHKTRASGGTCGGLCRSGLEFYSCGTSVAFALNVNL